MIFCNKYTTRAFLILWIVGIIGLISAKADSDPIHQPYELFENYCRLSSKRIVRMNQSRASSFGGGWLFFKRIDGAIGQWINRIYDSLPDHFPYFFFLSDRQGTATHMDEYGRANPRGPLRGNGRI